MVGIASYGIYIPPWRLSAADIAHVWGKNEGHVQAGLGVVEKAVAGVDEDTVTLGYEAAWRAVKSAGISPARVGALFVGSESHPYAVNPTATIIGEFLGLQTGYFAADTEFACKAGTTAMIVVDGLLRSGRCAYGLAIGADCGQAKPHDVLEYTAGSGAAACMLTSDENAIAVELVDVCSYSTDTPDFWRRDGISYPSHGGRFTGEPSYFRHVTGAATDMMNKHAMKPADIDFAVFHMPNGKFPREVAKRLGFSPEQVATSLVVDKIGNPYSASSLIGLAATLDEAKPGQTVLMVSYGSGAGSDAFLFRTTKKLPGLIKKQHSVKQKISMKQYVSYDTYLKMRGVI